MPREDRRLIFDYTEAYRAVYALCVQKELKKPPPGSLTKVTVDQGGEKKFTFQLENHQDNTTATVAYSSDFLAAALMLYCRTCGIPLPKRAQKSVMLKDDTVILRIVIG